MTKSKKTESIQKNPQFIVLCKPFIDGARLQVERLLSAQRLLPYDSVNAVYHCHHEASNLFEDLATIVQYLNLCNISLNEGQLYKDVRDLIRHDVREELDKDEKRKQKRAERLGINNKLQLELSYEIGSIKVGDTIINLKDISHFINLAEQIVNTLMLGGKIELVNDGRERVQE